jgi:hypothetical protein
MSDPSQVPGDASDERSPQERRVSIRYAMERRAYCQSGSGRSDQFWLFAKVLDLSAEGIRLETDRGFAAGTLLHVELPSADGADGETLPARVVHVTEGTKRWLLGCSFPRHLSAEELQRLL